MARKWSMTDRFAITDDTGTPQFDVQGRLAFAKRLSLLDAGGAEVAVITGKAFSSKYEILAGGHSASVRPRGFLGRRFEIDSTTGSMEARGNFSGRQYSIARGGAQVAAVSQLRSLRERFAVEVADGEDPVLMLSVVLVIETIRAEQRQAAAASAGTGG